MKLNIINSFTGKLILGLLSLTLFVVFVKVNEVKAMNTCDSGNYRTMYDGSNGNDGSCTGYNGMWEYGCDGDGGGGCDVCYNCYGANCYIVNRGRSTSLRSPCNTSTPKCNSSSSGYCWWHNSLKCSARGACYYSYQSGEVCATGYYSSSTSCGSQTCTSGYTGGCTQYCNGSGSCNSCTLTYTSGTSSTCKGLSGTNVGPNGACSSGLQKCSDNVCRTRCDTTPPTASWNTTNNTFTNPTSQTSASATASCVDTDTGAKDLTYSKKVNNVWQYYCGNGTWSTDQNCTTSGGVGFLALNTTCTSTGSNGQYLQCGVKCRDNAGNVNTSWTLTTNSLIVTAPNPTVSPAPSIVSGCSSGQIMFISWINTDVPVTWVDIAVDDPTFSTYYHKSIPSQLQKPNQPGGTYAPEGFYGCGTLCGNKIPGDQALQICEGKTYYVRLFNGTDYSYSSVTVDPIPTNTPQPWTKTYGGDIHINQ